MEIKVFPQQLLLFTYIVQALMLRNNGEQQTLGHRLHCRQSKPCNARSMQGPTSERYNLTL